MKYIQPPGEVADASYVDGNLSAGQEGSEVPAAAIEHPQRELAHLIEYFGLTPNVEDLQQVRKAIEAAIDAATGGGGEDSYVLMPQARARLPFFPEALTGDGKINVTSPGAGSVLVPSTVSFQHRGIYLVSTSDYTELERTFTTLANKTYHLRWNPDDGFTLNDVADVTYNPAALAEQNTALDTTYDDMLISRVVTNASNVATITNLVNKAVLQAEGETGNLSPTSHQDNKKPSELAAGTGSETFNLDWSRKPFTSVSGFTDVSVQTLGSINAEINVAVQSLSRYQVRCIYERQTSAGGAFISFTARA